MGVFSYKNYSDEDSKKMLSDAFALSMYSYHNLAQGIEHGYYNSGFHLGLPKTLITAIIGNKDSQGLLPGIPWNPNSEQQALEAVNKAGWQTISAKQLGYDGKTDHRGTFYGEGLFYSTAQAEIMGRYDDSGKLTQIGIAFRGTSGPREILLPDVIGDAVADVLIGMFPKYANNYVAEAFGDLLGQVAEFAKANGLSGSDVLVTGHSLGGSATNSMAESSETKWDGFFADSNYIALAGPSQDSHGKVFNVGYENDPVFRSLDGNKIGLATLGSHDKPHESTTDNIVNFNDYYGSSLWGLLPVSLANIPSWISHMPFFYQEGLTRVFNSDFYDLTTRDSTIIVANLSDSMRSKIWVEDHDRTPYSHKGPTFLIGSDYADMIKGGRGNDYMDGGAGNDIFRDTRGYNIILGGEGRDTFDLEKTLSRSEIAYDGESLYILNSKGMTIAHDVEVVRGKTSIFFGRETDYTVTDNGLVGPGNKLTAYENSVKGTDGDDVLTADKTSAWLFGLDGDDILFGSTRDDFFVGGLGNDKMVSNGGADTFLFEGIFGDDIIEGFSRNDTLIFMGLGEEAQGHTFRDYATQSGNDVVLTFGDSTLTLLNADLRLLASADVILA